MNSLLKSAMVIARRDYTATVYSKTFLLFLLGPILAFGFAGLLGYVGGKADREALRPAVTIVGAATQTAPIKRAYDGLIKRIGQRSLPELRFVAPRGDPEAQAVALLAAKEKSPSAVLTGWPGSPRLHGPAHRIAEVEESVSLILDEVRTDAVLATAGVARPVVSLARNIIDPAGGGSSSNRHLIARMGQTLLFFLTIILASMLLSNLVEEKSNKIIEILAAAVPIDAIFLGKLMAMLAVSLTGIVIWTLMAAAALLKFLPPGIPLPVPAIGWPLFGLFSVVYYIMNYTVLGAAFLGIGAQANSAREVQTLSMPVSMAQLAVFVLASAAVTKLLEPIGLAAMIFPLSSPLAMLSFAAQRSELWPHLLAVAWQALWVYIIIRVGSARFRATVLKSGPSVPGKRRFRLGRA